MKVTAAGWGLTSSHPSSSPDVPHEVQLQVSECWPEKDLCAGGSGKSWWKVRKCLAKIELTIFTDFYSNILRVIAVAPSHSSRGASTLSSVLLVGEILVKKVLLEKWSTIETGLKRIWEMPLNVECRKSQCGFVDWYEDDDIESFWTTICSMFLNIAFEINMYKVRVKVYVKDTGRAEFVTRNL